jgi:hypothetical protein
MKYFLEYRTVILRTLGAFMLVIGFVVNFWAIPKKGYSQVEIAAANVARMEKSLSSGNSKSTKKVKSNHSDISKVFKDTQEKQLKYFSIFALVFGACFLGYSFIKRK